MIQSLDTIRKGEGKKENKKEKAKKKKGRREVKKRKSEGTPNLPVDSIRLATSTVSLGDEQGMTENTMLAL